MRQAAYCTLIPLITPEELTLYKMLEGERKGNGGGRIIVNTQLSAFINPEWEVDDKFRNACFYGRITLASVRKNKSAAILIAILPRSGPYAKEVKELLEQYGVQTIVGDIPFEFEKIKVELSQALRSGLKPSLQTKRLINDGENLLARLAKAGLLNDEPYVTELYGGDLVIHHEVAVDSVIKVSPSSVENTEIHGYEELADYAKKARFDVLITTSVPHGKPLIAMEYDGDTFHASKRGRARDAKKDQLCKQSELLLIRVTSSQLPTRTQSPTTDSDVDGAQIFREFITYVTKVLTFKRRAAIQREANFRNPEDRLIWESLYEESKERNEFDRREYEAYIRSMFSSKIQLTKIVYESTGDGMTACAEIVDKVSGNIISRVQSPQVKLQMISEKNYWADDILKDFLLNWLHQMFIRSGFVPTS